MVDRELQKIRPYGEDHRGLVWGRRGAVPARKQSMKKIDVLKN